MARNSHPYKKIEGIYRPIIDITLRYNGKFLKYAVLVDSGADFNIFHIDVARFFGIDLTEAKEISFGGIKAGSEGQGKGKIAKIDIGVDGNFFETNSAFSGDISDNGYAIVGQIGFFNQFRSVQFNFPELVVNLK